MTMFTSSRSAYCITNNNVPQVGISFEPQLTNGGAPFTMLVNLYAGNPDTSPVVDSATLNFTDPDQSISLAGAGVKANGLFTLVNNVVQMDAEFDNGAISCNIIGPVAGFFYPNAFGQLTSTFTMRVGKIGVGPDLQLTAAIVGEEMQVSYEFEGASGSVKLPGINPVPVGYDANNIAIDGAFKNDQNTVSFQGAFIKSGVIQVDFMDGTFACFATPSA